VGDQVILHTSKREQPHQAEKGSFEGGWVAGVILLEKKGNPEREYHRNIIKGLGTCAFFGT